jgi:hypothetical protein
MQLFFQLSRREMNFKSFFSSSITAAAREICLLGEFQFFFARHRLQSESKPQCEMRL